MLNEKDIIRLGNFCRKFYADNEKDIETFDFEAEIDRTLTYLKNKEILLKKMQNSIGFSIQKSQFLSKNQAEIMPDEEYEVLVQKSEEEEAKRIQNETKPTENAEVFKLPVEYIKSVIKGYHNAFIFLGSHGLGKTTITLKTLTENNCKFVFHSGISTPLALYEFLYEHRENEIIVFDDCTGLINNPAALSIILAALWGATDKRIVNWNTTKDNVNIPTKFVFDSRVIIITNKMPQAYYANVVLSRCLTYQIKMDYHQILEFMESIGDKEIVDYIKENSSPATKNFDLRLLKKAEKFKEYDKKNWRTLIKPMLDETDEYMEMILQGMGEYAFMEKTGKSRRTYYNYRKKCKSAVQSPMCKEKGVIYDEETETTFR